VSCFLGSPRQSKLVDAISKELVLEPLSCFFPLGATACHAVAAVLVLGIIQRGQNEVNFFTCTQTLPECSENCI